MRGTKIRIGVFAPSSPFADERFQRGLDRLRALGVELFLHRQLEERNGYLAGSDRARIDAFHDLISDNNVDAVIAARGGYGAHRIIEQIDFERVRAANKPLIGFSDVCAFHSAILSRLGRTGIHGPVVTQLGELPDADTDALLRLLTAPPERVVLEAQKPSIAPGHAEGILAGGCLSVIAPMIGSELLYLPAGSILLLEDVGEAPYRIDRLLTHLRLAGVLQRLAGVALGDFIGCNSPREHEQTIDEVLADRLGDLGIPVISGLPIGHGKRNYPVTLGRTASIDAEARTLTLS
jgi:muramoyltetrapeptide carboxypeptidase